MRRSVTWEVWRMNRSRILVLAIAIVAGAIAAYLASGPGTPPAAAPVAQLATVDVLVAKSDINLGQRVTPDVVQWESWPASTASSSFIRRNDRPDATKEVTGSIARYP